MNTIDDERALKANNNNVIAIAIVSSCIISVCHDLPQLRGTHASQAGRVAALAGLNPRATIRSLFRGSSEAPETEMRCVCEWFDAIDVPATEKRRVCVRRGFLRPRGTRGSREECERVAVC
jgi:hypothetical protein